MNNVAETIQHYYQTILNRTGSAEEVAGWVNLVDNAGISLQQVETSFINSFEALDNVAPIVEMYQAHLGRQPDQAGLTYWVGELDSGAMTLAQIGLAIASSPESQAFYGTAFDADFITTLYERILGREPEEGVVDTWLAAKADGMTQAQMQEAFRASAEAGGRAAPAVTTFFEAAVQGSPGVYSGSLFDSGLSFVLTTGHDFGAAFTGTAGNDTFQAIEDTSSVTPVPVWTTADAIDGGGGTNTFNVTQTAAITGVPLAATVSNIQIANIVDAATVTLNTTDWTGLTSLNVTDSGATDLTVADGTDATVVDSAGTVSITGGSSQTVTTSAGGVSLSGASGPITVTDTEVGTDAISVDGGSSVTITASGETSNSSTITVGNTTAPTGAVTITASTSPETGSSFALGTISVQGGSVVDVTQDLQGAAGSTRTAGSVVVQGTATTTSVSVSATARATPSGSVAGVVNNSVAISDVNAESSTLAGTITSISASNYTTIGIADNALTTLSLAGGSGNIIIDNSGLTTPTNTTLDATFDGLTGGTLDDADIYTALNITTTNTNSRLANITTGAVSALSVAGSKRLTLTSTAGLTALQTVTVLGAAGIVADFSGAPVTSVDTSGTTGASTVTINGNNANFTGGAGDDTVVVTVGASKVISLGDGDDSLVLGALVPTAAISGGEGTDTLSMTAALAATASASGTFASLVTGFEKLILTGATNQTIDLAVLGITGGVQTSGGNGLTLSNLPNGGTLTLSGAGTAYTIGNSAFSSGLDDTVNLVLTDGSGAGVSFAATGITASGVENFVITTVDTQATPSGTFNDLVTLLGNSSKSITVGGNAGLTLTATSTHLTTVDASGITLGGFTYTSGALASAASIKGSAAGTNTVNFSAATSAVTYTGGSGNDAVTATNGRNNVIDLGDGNNSLVATSGNNTITSGSGNDTIVATSGNNTISTGDGTDAVVVSSGNNTITMGSGAKTVTVGSGANTITLGAHSAVTADSMNVGATALGSFVPTATITGLNTAGLDTITFVGDTATTFAAFTADQLISFGDALGNNVTAGSAPPTLAAAVADVLGTAGGNLAQHGIGAFQYGGNTYLVEQAAAQGTAFSAGDTLVELTGSQTFNTTSVSSGTLHLLT